MPVVAEQSFSEEHQTGVEFSRQIKGTLGQNLFLLKGKTFRGKGLGAKMGLLKVAAGVGGWGFNKSRWGSQRGKERWGAVSKWDNLLLND